MDLRFTVTQTLVTDKIVTWVKRLFVYNTAVENEQKDAQNK